MKLIFKLLISTVSVLIAAYLLPGVHVNSFTTAMIVAIVLGLFNTFLKPILILLTLPMTILTLGLFIFVINVFLILLASNVVPGFAIDSVFSAILFGLIMSLVNSFLSNLAE